MQTCTEYNIEGKPLEECGAQLINSFYDFLQQAQGCCDGFVVAIDPETELCKPDLEDFRIFIDQHLEELCSHESIN